MNLRRTSRLLVLALLAASFAACHFHGHGCGGWGSWSSHCHTPVRHCR